jgi:hypothetical protein
MRSRRLHFDLSFVLMLAAAVATSSAATQSVRPAQDPSLNSSSYGPCVTCISHPVRDARPFSNLAAERQMSVLVGDQLQGMHGHGHDQLHAWYETLRQPGTGYSCCNNKDCRPTTARTRGETIEVLVDGEWTVVPPSTILNENSPDLNTHVCAPKGPWKTKPIFCVVLGFGV